MTIAATGLVACGFRPRGTLELSPSLRRLSLEGDVPPRLRAVMTQLLRQQGGVLVQADDSTTRLIIRSMQQLRRETVIDARARIRQVELTLTALINARTPDGRRLLENERFEVARYMSYDPNNLLAGNEEAARLIEDLYESLAQTVFARLRQQASLPTPAAP